MRHFSGKPSKFVFLKSWELGPTGLTPLPLIANLSRFGPFSKTWDSVSLLPLVGLNSQLLPNKLILKAPLIVK